MICRSHLFMALAFCLASSASAQQIPKFGIVGDSLSDEYADQAGETCDYSYAKNWNEQLVEAGVIDLGPTAVEADQLGGTWGDVRRGGTSTTMLYTAPAHAT